jgi:type IV pilus assembly protein PilF
MKGIILTLLAITLVSCSSNKKSSNDEKAMIYYGHGTEKLIQKDYTAALQNLLKANELKADDSKIINNLAMAYYFKGRENKAIDLLKKSLDLNPKNSDARNNLASIYFNQNRIDLAREQYNKVLEDLLYRHTYRIHYNLGLLDLRQNKIGSAVKNLEKAAGLKVDYCAANLQLARVYKKMKNISLASKWYNHSVKGECAKLPEPNYERAMLLVDLGKDKEAIEALKTIIKDNPTHRLAYEAKRKLSLLNKDNSSFANKYEKVETFNSGDF